MTAAAVLPARIFFAGAYALAAADAAWLAAGGRATGSLPGGVLATGLGPLSPLALRLDGLSGLFLLVILLAAASDPRGSVARRTVRLAGLALAVLGADPATATGGAILALVSDASVVPLLALAALRLVALTGAPGWTGGAWLGPALMLAGTALAIGGGAGTLHAPTLDRFVRDIGVGSAGLAVAGAGVALAGRTADLPALVALGVSATLLQVVGQGVLQPLVARAAALLAEQGGSQALDRLGGLGRAMPQTALALVVGLLGVVGLPPSIGFAALWPLLQAVLTVLRLGGPVLPLAGAVAAAGLALAMALRLAGVVRLLGVAVLGRPRSPRAAGAQEPPAPQRRVVLVLAGAAALLGAIPDIALRLAAPAQALTVGGDVLASRLTVRGAADAYTPAVLLIVLLLILGVTAAARGRARLVSPWEGGGAPPPPWLPFGDPALLADAASVAETTLPLSRVRALGRTVPARLRAAVAGQRDARHLLAGLLAAFLIVLGASLW